MDISIVASLIPSALFIGWLWGKNGSSDKLNNISNELKASQTIIQNQAKEINRLRGSSVTNNNLAITRSNDATTISKLEAEIRKLNNIIDAQDKKWREHTNNGIIPINPPKLKVESLIPINPPKTHCVYLIHPTGMEDINVGYVGVTKNFQARLNSHATDMLNKSHPNYKLNRAYETLGQNIEMTKLFDNLSEDEAYDKEAELRPYWNTGWNIAPGGKEGKHYIRKRK